jgi:beta-galactosidase/beta-glucuronidase
VWLESVPAMRLGNSSQGTVLRSDDIEKGQVHASVAVIGRSSGEKCTVEIEASLGGRVVGKSKQESGIDRDLVKMDVDIKVADSNELQKLTPHKADGACVNGLALWQPEHPNLYDLTLRLYNSAGKVVDEVKTTAGMRKLEWYRGDGTFRLNNKPYFQALVLDQGYWPETGMTPPSPEACRTDIEISMEMGFNGCRKHQKVEDPLFLYWADRLGYLVWDEIANAYEYDQEYAERFNGEWMEVVRRDVNHPCVVTWTPVNESWGYTMLQDGVPFAPGNVTRADESTNDAIEQRNHIRALYYLTK